MLHHLIRRDIEFVGYLVHAVGIFCRMFRFALSDPHKVLQSSTSPYFCCMVAAARTSSGGSVTVVAIRHDAIFEKSGVKGHK
jgi:hypothetical protein